MSDTGKEDIIAKIKKVMRLAKRAATEGEKTAAEESAKRLAFRAGVNLDDIEVSDADIKTEERMDAEWSTWPGSEIGYITAVLREHFGVIPIQHRHGNKVKYRWVGTAINIEIAKHIYVLLLRECRKAWKDARIAKGLARGLAHQSYGYKDPSKQRQLVALSNLKKRSFLDGWFYTIHEKLRANPIRNDIEQFKAEKKDCEEFFRRMQEEQDIEDREDRKSKDQDRTSVLMGFKAAKSVNLSRPCEGRGYSGPAAEIGIRQKLGFRSI